MDKLNKRWLRTPDGIDFVNALADMLAPRFRKGESASAFTAGTKSGVASVTAELNVATSADPAADWDVVVNDYLSGLFGALAISAPTSAQMDPFKAYLQNAYQERFLALHAGLNVDLTRHQARVLGTITANMFRVNKGDIPGYPTPDPNVMLDVKHLDWARELLGFWLLGLNRFDAGIPRPTLTAGTLPEEFEGGCTLC
jgi:hypothetical protein